MDAGSGKADLSFPSIVICLWSIFTTCPQPKISPKQKRLVKPDIEVVVEVGGVLQLLREEKATNIQSKPIFHFSVE